MQVFRRSARVLWRSMLMLPVTVAVAFGAAWIATELVSFGAGKVWVRFGLPALVLAAVLYTLLVYDGMHCELDVDGTLCVYRAGLRARCFATAGCVATLTSVCQLTGCSHRIVLQHANGRVEQLDVSALGKKGATALAKALNGEAVQSGKMPEQPEKTAQKQVYKRGAGV